MPVAVHGGAVRQPGLRGVVGRQRDLPHGLRVLRARRRRLGHLRRRLRRLLRLFRDVRPNHSRELHVLRESGLPGSLRRDGLVPADDSEEPPGHLPVPPGLRHDDHRRARAGEQRVHQRPVHRVGRQPGARHLRDQQRQPHVHRRRRRRHQPGDPDLRDKRPVVPEELEGEGVPNTLQLHLQSGGRLSAVLYGGGGPNQELQLRPGGRPAAQQPGLQHLRAHGTQLLRHSVHLLYGHGEQPHARVHAVGQHAEPRGDGELARQFHGRLLVQQRLAGRAVRLQRGPAQHQHLRRPHLRRHPQRRRLHRALRHLQHGETVPSVVPHGRAGSASGRGQPRFLLELRAAALHQQPVMALGGGVREQAANAPKESHPPTPCAAPRPRGCRQPSGSQRDHFSLHGGFRLLTDGARQQSKTRACSLRWVVDLVLPFYLIIRCSLQSHFTSHEIHYVILITSFINEL